MKHTKHALTALLLVLTASISAYSQTKTVEPEKAIEQTIAAGETHSYTMTLPAGMYGAVDLDQKKINLTLTILSADGQKVRIADLTGVGFAEEICLVAQAATTYRVEVNAPGRSDLKGSYTLKLTQIHPATDDDRLRVQAQTLSEEGMQFLINQTATSKSEALDKFQKSISLWHAVKDQAYEAQAFYYVAYTSNSMGQYANAAEAAEKGGPLARAAGNKNLEAYLLDELGASFSNRGERKQALDIFLEALKLRSDADPVGRSMTLNNIAIAYWGIGERRKALGYLEQFVSLLHEMGERLKESTTLGNMCVVHNDLGEFKQAFELCRQALEIKREIKDIVGQATTLSNTGNIYGNMGDYEKALDLYQQALALHNSIKNEPGAAIVINNIAWAYGQLGEPQKAIDYYTQAIESVRKRNKKDSLATLYSNIGASYAELKDFSKALEFHLQALELRPEKDDRDGRAMSLNNIASCYSHLGDQQKALEYYTQAVAMYRTVENNRSLSTALKNFGAFQRKQGQIAKALEYLNEARTLSANVSDPSGEASTLSEIAKLEFDRGNLPAALKLIEQAIGLTESIRINLKSQSFRTSYLASVREYYEFEIQVLMALHQQRPDEGFAAAAIQVSERSRARSLLELLREARAEIRQGADPSLVALEGQLRRMIVEKAQSQTRLLSGKYTEEQAVAAAKEVDDLTTEYDEVQRRIRESSPRYAALVEPAPLSVTELQKRVLDQNTLLLEYALGEQKSFVWVVASDSVKTFELPGRAAIEQEAKRFYQLLTERGTTVPNETLAQQQQRLAHVETDYSTVAAKLSGMLLGPPAAELGQKRLLVVAEGVLQYVPFAALPAPGGDVPLIVDHEIVNLPSASVLALLREEFGDRKSASKTVAVLADPVFSADDARLAHATKIAADSSPFVDAQRSAVESGMDGLVRLRFSRQEADEIARLAGDKRNMKAVDFAANRATATDARLGDYQIVHFATHGLINNQHPDLSGVVLSLVDEQGKAQNGFLRLYDIYNLKLNADLVVLSACQTALGKEIKGEGLIGLTRGFMYAGAPRVVATLWRIDDRASADMMRRFYEAMLKDGLRPTAALRAAQISMLRDRRWHSPHFWAPFTLQGEWR
jgi:CHAT domain-containing protein/tetratricopeptide (TPR) repeat protein